MYPILLISVIFFLNKVNNVCPPQKYFLFGFRPFVYTYTVTELTYQNLFSEYPQISISAYFF